MQTFQEKIIFYQLIQLSLPSAALIFKFQLLNFTVYPTDTKMSKVMCLFLVFFPDIHYAHIRTESLTLPYIIFMHNSEKWM